MHTLFSELLITRSDNMPYLKWAVSLVITDGDLIFIRGLYGYVKVNILTLSPLIGLATIKVYD